MTEKTIIAEGTDALAMLDQMADQNNNGTAVKAEATKTEAEAFHYEPQPVNLLVGWRFCTWKQRHVMALYESGALTDGHPNRFRRNFEVVKAAIEAGCFEAPIGIEPDTLLDLPVQDVEQLHDAVAAQYMNTVLTPKN